MDHSPKPEQKTANETEQDGLLYQDTEIYSVYNHNVFCMVSDFQSIKQPIALINKSFFVEVMQHWLVSPTGGPLRVLIFFRLLNPLSSQLCRRMTSWYVCFPLPLHYTLHPVLAWTCNNFFLFFYRIYKL